MPAPRKIHDLVDRFHRNAGAYKSLGYKETELRREFIDPFFEALGWDVTNRKGYAESYKEVVHEPRLRAESGEAPDYSFRIGGTRKFFVEVKKPSVNIKDDPKPAFQLRHYAWNAKLPLSILTDFEEFSVYDTRVQPNVDDRASTARILHWRFEQYPTVWEEIVKLFSPEGIKRGELDRLAQAKPKAKGTLEVDELFLSDLEAWRDALARDLAEHNTISSRDLNSAVQATIDRIVFLRICEDRGIEVHGSLRVAVQKTEAYSRLIDVFRKADAKYNSGLFHFKRESGRAGEHDRLTPHLTVSDSVLRHIILGLYAPRSPYKFSFIPSEILGQVYERFLGKVIVLNEAGHASVKLKPEVRKSGGVFYTPTHIVEYIVQATLGPLLENNHPDKVAEIKILDPACGSGSFLLGAYHHLLRWHLAYYEKKGRNAKRWSERFYRGPDGTLRLTTSEKRRILLQNIFGVDIDAQAVEVTKLSLLLAVLEDETEETLSSQMRLFKERALPNLAGNVRSGNSLIGYDYYDVEPLELLTDEERYELNAFDWNDAFRKIMYRGGFDVIIGNPPYDVVEKDRGEASWPHDKLRKYIQHTSALKNALGGKLNLFRFFVVKSVSLLREGGRFGMIVPLSIMGDISTAATRRHFFESMGDVLADAFPQKDDVNRRIFKEAKLSTVVITAVKNPNANVETAEIVSRVFPANSFSDPHHRNTIRIEHAALLDPCNLPIPLTSPEGWAICSTLHTHKSVTRLGNIREIEITRGEINQTIYRAFITSDLSQTRLLKGVEVGRYRLNEHLSQGAREWFDEAAYLKLHQRKAQAGVHRIATQRITGVDERYRIVGTLVHPITYFADSTNSIVLRQDSLYSYDYVLALLNSWLWQFRFKVTSTNNNVQTNELESMPFRQIDFGDSADLLVHEQLSKLAQNIRSLHVQYASARAQNSRETLHRQITASEMKVDTLVYSLYGLSVDQIKLVEQTRSGRAASMPGSSKASPQTTLR